MEHDRNEAGEWDYVLNRFTPIGYQNVLAVAVGGFLRGEVPKNNDEMRSKILIKIMVYMLLILKSTEK